MTTYYLCNLAAKKVEYCGELPPVWGNLSGLSEDNDECLKDLTWAGHPNMGFLKREDVLGSGISVEEFDSVNDAMREYDWKSVRRHRDNLIWQVRWRVERHRDERDMGRVPTEDITEVLNYIQALRDITHQSDPNNVKWPIPPQ